jgi:hypothetical protein
MAVVSELLEQGLRQAHLSLVDVKGICVSIGPGSFTGMRIGLAYAYGLGQGLVRPLYFGTSSLEAAAQILAAGRGQSVTLVVPSTRTHGFMASADEMGRVTAEARLVDLGSQEDLGLLKELVVGNQQLVSRTKDQAGEGKSAPKSPVVLVFGVWPPLQNIAAGLAWPQQTEADATQALQVIDADKLCRSALEGMAYRVLTGGLKAFGEVPPEPRFLRLSTAEENLGKSSAATKSSLVEQPIPNRLPQERP